MVELRAITEENLSGRFQSGAGPGAGTLCVASDPQPCAGLRLLEAVLLPLAHHWGFWKSGTDILVYAGFILLAKALWHLADYSLNAKTAAQINERIRKNRLEKKTGKE